MRPVRVLALLLLPTTLAALAPHAAGACPVPAPEDPLACVPPCPAGCVLASAHWVTMGPLCPGGELECPPNEGLVYAAATFYARAWADVPDVTCSSSETVVLVLHNGPEACTIVTETLTTDPCVDVFLHGHAVGPRTGAEAFETRVASLC